MGLLASFLCAVFAASKDLVSKKLAFRMDGTASTFASFAFALPFYLVVLVVLYLLGLEDFTLPAAFLGLVFLRALTDVFAEGMKMHALGHGDLSLVASFMSMSPLFLLVTSPLITGEELSVLGVVAMFLVVGGSLVLVYRPSSMSWAAQRKGILLAVGASLFFSLNTCFDKLAVDKSTPVFSGFAMTLLAAVFLLPLVLPRQDRLLAMQVYAGGLFARGGLEIAFMVSKLYALQHTKPTYVVAVGRLSLLLSILGGRVFFREQDFGRRLTAGLLILLGVFLIAWLQTVEWSQTPLTAPMDE
jgi:drug/metabolite transporter (DMT)-like permease